MKGIHFLRVYLIGLILNSGLSQAVLPRFNSVDEINQLSDVSVRTVVQDQQGFIWGGTNRGVFRYDGYQLSTQFTDPRVPNPVAGLRINTLLVNSNDVLWIGSNTQGLYAFDGQHWYSGHSQLPGNIKKINQIQTASQIGSLWAATGQGLYLIDDSTIANYSPQEPILAEHNVMTVLEHLNVIYVGTDNGLYRYDRNSQLTTPLFEVLNQLTIHELYLDSQEQLWIATSQGLYQTNAELNQLTLIKETKNRRVTDVQAYKDELWIGTITGGLMQRNSQSGEVEQFLSDKNQANSLSGDHVMSLFLDRDENLWIGQFGAGLDLLPMENMAFGLETAASGSYFCAETADAHAFVEIGELVLIGGEGSVIKYQPSDGSCQISRLSNNTENRTPIYGMEVMTNEGSVLLATGDGLYNYEVSTGSVQPFNQSELQQPFFFSAKENNQSIFLGGAKGLWRLSDDYQDLEMIPFEKETSFFAYSKSDQHGQYFLTENHLLKLSQNAYLKSIFETDYSLRSLLTDQSGTIWIGSQNHGLLKVDDEGHHEFVLADHPDLNDATIVSIKQYGDQLWMGSNKGIIVFDINQSSIKNFRSSSALQALQYYPNAIYLSTANDLYLGGRYGYNKLSLNNILSLAADPPKVKITELKRFNRTVWPGQTECEICIQKPIEKLNDLVLGYKDDIIGFQWSALSYANPKDVQFAYRLLGLEQEWNLVDSTDRNITYSSLRPGNYTFQVKASQNGFDWREQPTSINIHVTPAPWLSLWAFVFYALMLMVLVCIIIYNRTRSARVKAIELENKVAERTLELQEKNNVIASLLKQKNALFSNITHEFKTPLTLILGPLNKIKKFLRNQSPNESKINPLDDVQMIDRNANRLLNMVGHLLKLSEAEDSNRQNKVTVQISVISAMIVDSFKPIAEKCGSTLMLDSTSCSAETVITTAPESYEMILGNLLSNAIKYAGENAQINVVLIAEDDVVKLSVEDNGPGIALADQEQIFERFSRLNQHTHIEGNGIGLAVVKQLVEINGGQLILDSDLGKGTTFKICLPRSDEVVSQTNVHEIINTLTNQSVIDPVNKSETVSEDEAIYAEQQIKNKPTILIIEDNSDMRSYIISELEFYFNCHVAEDGQLGIEACVKIIPDIVISDVMMPVMDGYEVANHLRQDQRTSHIPIVLLTALNTTQSRIKGWQEHVDSYLTKPFDSEELLIKLHSILAIRQLLQAKNSKRFGSHDELDLPEIDNAFIEKLRKVIKLNFTNPNFHRCQMSSEMAISERQLLRKTKALIGISPMDALREYRLEQSIEMLKTGKPVNLVSDATGFNSTSYFVRCFKSKYHTTPKQFQKQYEGQ